MAEQKHSNIGQILGSISDNRDTIGSVFGLMGLRTDKDNPDTAVGQGSTLAQLAAAATTIDIRSGGEPELLYPGHTSTDFQDGVYFTDTQVVSIDIDTKYEAGVYPLNETCTYTPTSETQVIASFTVRKTPSKPLEVDIEDLISSTDNSETNNILIYEPGTVTSELGSGIQVPCWYNEVKIPQVMLGDYTAVPEDVFDPNRTDVIEITAQTLNEREEIEFASSGIRTVIIPKPDPQSCDKEIDIYNRELKFDSEGNVINFSEEAAAGMIKTSYFTADITDLYNTLVNI